MSSKRGSFKRGVPWNPLNLLGSAPDTHTHTRMHILYYSETSVISTYKFENDFLSQIRVVSVVCILEISYALRCVLSKHQTINILIEQSRSFDSKLLPSSLFLLLEMTHFCGLHSQSSPSSIVINTSDASDPDIS